MEWIKVVVLIVIILGVAYPVLTFVEKFLTEFNKKENEKTLAKEKLNHYIKEIE